MKRAPAQPPHRDLPARVPVLYPADVPRAWAATASWRVAAAPDGTLVRRDGAGGRHVLAGPGGVTGAQVVLAGARVGGVATPARTESVVLTRADAPPVVLPVDPWTPAPLRTLPVRGSQVRTVERLAPAGFRALVAGLGRDDAWSFDLHGQGGRTLTELAGGDRPTVVDPVGDVLLPPTLRRHRNVAVAAGLAYAVYFPAAGIVADVTDGRLRWPVDVFLVLSLLTMLPVFGWGVALLLRGRRRLFAPVAGAEREVPDLPAPARLVTLAGGDLAAVDPGGRETQLAGPGAGGVSSAVAFVQERRGVRTVHLHAAGEDGEPAPAAVLELPATWWGDTPAAAAAVRDWLESAGVDWREATVPRNAPDLAGSGDWGLLGQLWPSPLTAHLGVTAALSLGSSVIAAYAWAWPAVLPGALAMAVRLALLVPRYRDGTRGRGATARRS